jgi:hypothetical protein
LMRVNIGPASTMLPISDNMMTKTFCMGWPVTVR